MAESRRRSVCAGPAGACPRATHRAVHGFTLLELLVALAIAAILAVVAAPSFRSVFTSNAVGALTSDFSTALGQARGLAIANNMCATLCTATVSAGGDPVCTVPGASGFQQGWIVFTNPACDADQTDPAAAGGRLRQTQNEGAEGYGIAASDAALYRLMFDPRGISTASAGGLFQITAPDDSANQFTRTICLDAAGRAVVRAYSTSCN